MWLDIRCNVCWGGIYLMKQTFLDLVDSARLSSLLLDVITELFRSLSPFPRSPAVSAINSTQKSEDSNFYKFLKFRLFT